MIAATLFEIVGYLISVIVMLVIVQFVMSLLISFNVVNMHNDFVAAIWKAINALLDQVLGDLSGDMERVLEGLGLGARRLELGLWKVDGEVLLRRLDANDERARFVTVGPDGPRLSDGPAQIVYAEVGKPEFGSCPANRPRGGVSRDRIIS